MFWRSLVLLLLPLYSWAFTVISTDNPDMLGWEQPVLNVALNTANCPEKYDMVEIVTRAMNVWNFALAGKFQMRLGGASGTSAADAIGGSAPDSPVIVCDPEFVAHTRADGNTTPGQSGVLLDTGINHLVYGYMLLNVQPDAIANIANIPMARVYAIVGHEFGHILGLGHSDEPRALMYYDVSNKRGPELHEDDIQGAIHLYTPRPGKDGSPMGCGIVESAEPGSRPGPHGLAAVLLLLSVGYFVIRRRGSVPN